MTLYVAWICIPHSSFWPFQRPERGLLGPKGSDVKVAVYPYAGMQHQEIELDG